MFYMEKIILTSKNKESLLRQHDPPEVFYTMGRGRLPLYKKTSLRRHREDNLFQINPFL